MFLNNNVLRRRILSFNVRTHLWIVAVDFQKSSILLSACAALSSATVTSYLLCVSSSCPLFLSELSVSLDKQSRHFWLRFWIVYTIIPRTKSSLTTVYTIYPFQTLVSFYVYVRSFNVDIKAMHAYRVLPIFSQFPSFTHVKYYTPLIASRHLFLSSWLAFLFVKEMKVVCVFCYIFYSHSHMWHIQLGRRCVYVCNLWYTSTTTDNSVENSFRLFRCCNLIMQNIKLFLASVQRLIIINIYETTVLARYKKRVHYYWMSRVIKQTIFLSFL